MFFLSNIAYSYDNKYFKFEKVKRPGTSKIGHKTDWSYELQFL